MINFVLIALIAWPIIGWVCMYGYAYGRIVSISRTHGVKMIDVLVAMDHISDRLKQSNTSNHRTLKMNPRDELFIRYMKWPIMLYKIEHHLLSKVVTELESQ